MNVNLLTIDNMLAGVSNTPPTQPRHDTGARDKPVSPLADDKPIQASSARIETTDNIVPYAGRADVEKPVREFHEVLRDKTKSESPQESRNTTESKKERRLSDPAVPADVVRTWLAENAVPVLQSKEGIAVKMEPKAGRELAQLITSLKTEKSPPVTGDAAKSAQIKLALLAGEKGQLGLKTVLPEKSNGQNGLKTVLPDTPMIMPIGKVRPETAKKSEKIVPRNEAAADTKALANKGQVKELTSELPAGLGKADESGKKAANTAADVNPSAVKTPTTAAKKDVISDTTVETGDKKTAADGKKTSVRVDLAAIQASLVEKQSLLAASNPARSAPSTQANATDSARQAPSKSSDRNGKESEHAGNEPSNAPAFRKLNVSEVQVSADQPKEQGHPAGQKRPSGKFEQILSHGPGQIPATQQSAASAANAKPAGSPCQNPPNNPAADVGKQILESIHGSLAQQKGDQQITVRLNPPELGKVFIKLQERDAELTGILEVSRSQTRAEIEHALPQIIRNLADCGIQVKRLDVVLSEQGRPEQEAFGDQSPQNSGPYEHDSANQQTWSNETNAPQVSAWSTNSGGYQNVSEWQQPFVTDSSINMLI